MYFTQRWIKAEKLFFKTAEQMNNSNNIVLMAKEKVKEIAKKNNAEKHYIYSKEE
jgi:hypothetical protein